MPVNIKEFNVEQSTLNPNVHEFVVRDPTSVHRGILVPDLDKDWKAVQFCQDESLKDCCYDTITSRQYTQSEPKQICRSHSTNQQDIMLTLPFPYAGSEVEGGFALSSKAVQKTKQLRDRPVQMPGRIFTDKILPPTSQCCVFSWHQSGWDYLPKVHSQLPWCCGV